MSNAARKKATYADLLAVPPPYVAEIIRGTLVTMPRPHPRHALASSQLGGELHGFGSSRGGPGGWLLLDEPELHLTEEIVVPDLAGWRRERMPTLPDEAWFSLPPDWVCEVLSPSTAALDRAESLPIYAEHTVGHVWLLDPEIQTLEVFQLDGRSFRLLHTAHGEAKVRAEPFEALELDLSVLWRL
jgi:Uma2 family endonuclease